MTDDKTYNGWTNYETWNVALWLDNDQGSYRHWRSEAQDAWDSAEATSYRTRESVATRDLADRLKTDLEEGNPLADQASCYSDLLGAALSEVNWDEIASHYIADVDKEEEEEEEEDVTDGE